MPTGIPSDATKERNELRAINEWERWEREHYPIYNQQGDVLFEPADDEIFVPLFHYKEDKDERKLRENPAIRRVKGTIDPRYMVSNKGNVISLTFHKIGRPFLMKQTEKLNTRDEPYMVCGSGGWSVHSLVWFSFAADAIRNGYEFPKSYGIPVDEIISLERLARLTGENLNRQNAEGDYWIEIHHKDLNTRNNSLENLECDVHALHKLLHDLNDMESEEERWNTICEYPFERPTLIELEGTLSISDIDVDKFLAALPDGEIQKIHREYWTMYTKAVLNEVISILGKDFFKRDWYMGLTGKIYDKGLIAFFSVVKESDGGMSINWLDAESHNQLVDKQLDIFCENGRIYLMGFTNDEEIYDGEE